MGDVIQINTRGARKRAGMTQAAWADACFCSLDNVRRLEYKGGLPSWPTALRMAHVSERLEISAIEEPMVLIPLRVLADLRVITDDRTPPPAAPAAAARIPEVDLDEAA